jgi:phospholipid transport system substrate-binding protein
MVITGSFFMPRILRSVLFALTLIVPMFATSPQVLAADVQIRTHSQAVQSPVGKFIQDLGDNAIKIVANKQLSSSQRSAAFSTILSDNFDIKTIGRFVIGRTWNQATPGQKDEYMDLFKSLVIRTYGSRMTLYTGEGFEVVGTRTESDMDTVVMSRITHPDGSKSTNIDWRVRQKDSKMGVIDVVVEGVSLSVTQKQEYSSVIQNNGGNIDGLLKVMRAQLDKNTADASR